MISRRGWPSNCDFHGPLYSHSATLLNKGSMEILSNLGERKKLPINLIRITLHTDTRVILNYEKNTRSVTFYY